MRIGLGQNISLSQELRLHPQLILMLKLLPLTALELEGMVRQELEENPVLEEVPDLPQEGEPDVREDAPHDPLPGAGADGLISETEEGPDVASKETTEYLDLVDSDNVFSSGRGEPVGSSEYDPMELAADEGPGLVESLMPALRAELGEQDAGIAEIILQSVDADGFLTVSHDELIEAYDLDRARFENIIDRIRHIEPGGIGSCSRQEALVTQLEMHGFGPESLEHRLVAEFWTPLLQMQLGKIARLCGVGEEDIRRAAEGVHGLEMRPARRFSRRMIEYVSPDFTVTWRGDGPTFDYNDDREPHLRLSRNYVEMLRHPERYSKEQVAFARGKYNRAVMFLKAIESRRQTLRKLMQVILDQQRDFFELGPEHLKPATLRDAAGSIGVHPSTVSRASAGKYVETDYGIFPVKHFFKAGASDKSRASIKEFIRGMVEKEDRSKPLSDEAIGARLKEEQGVEISRRTVAKYRGELDIPGRNQRGRL